MEPKNPPLPANNHKATTLPNPDEHLPFNDRAKFGVRERQVIASERIEGELSQLNYFMSVLTEFVLGISQKMGIPLTSPEQQSAGVAGPQLSPEEAAVVNAMRATRAAQQTVNTQAYNGPAVNQWAPVPDDPTLPPPRYQSPDLEGFQRFLKETGAQIPIYVGKK